MHIHVHLERGEIYLLHEACQTIQVIAGAAWISVDDVDVLVNQGEQAVIRPGEHPAIISGVGSHSLVYEIRNNYVPHPPPPSP
jgi:hypothetical protein